MADQPPTPFGQRYVCFSTDFTKVVRDHERLPDSIHSGCDECGTIHRLYALGRIATHKQMQHRGMIRL